LVKKIKKVYIYPPMNDPKTVSIYTDGGCDPNPGPGGYGVVLVLGKHRRELSGGFRLTTNNRMELYAAITGLRALKETSRVTLYSDSEYLVNAMTQGWIQRWQHKNWKKVKNPDLWKILLDLCSQHQVTFNWIKGHAGHPENERCDQLAMHALLGQDLPADESYELLENAKRSTKGSLSESPKAKNLTLFDE
jgi:ribonuclease HI